MHTMEKRDILRLLLATFLLGLVVLIVAKFSPGFVYDIESNLYSNRDYYPAVK
ncbi:MAG: hypothetical protein DDT32_00718 [Syntrophomonadaceae bacterium]|nr:hypothetical protein [Bacillota bacterium]